MTRLFFRFSPLPGMILFMTPSENATPSREVPAESTVEYVGFFKRFIAALIDSLLLTVLVIPFLIYFYGLDLLLGQVSRTDPLYVLLNYVLPALVLIIFWHFRSSSPGKLLFNAVIVDAKTLQKPKSWQLWVRYLGYYVSIFPCMLGIIWVAFDPKKRGWHDFLAGTLVVRKKKPSVEKDPLDSKESPIG